MIKDPYAAYSAHDPDTNIFDLSQRNIGFQKDVYAEKPLSLYVSEGRALVQSALESARQAEQLGNAIQRERQGARLVRKGSRGVCRRCEAVVCKDFVGDNRQPAGRGQRYYVYGATASYPDLVTYYRTQLRDRGEQVFEEPPTHMFSMGRFREETMAFPPSVTVKDYQSDISQGYPNPKVGGDPARFPTIIQIVPPVERER